jgi:hypothetical protein
MIFIEFTLVEAYASGFDEFWTNRETDANLGFPGFTKL